jgi:type IV pilus assembly protein PilY1
MNNSIIRCAFMMASMLFSLSSPAEDIDLFMGPTPPEDISTPNVLFVIDNTGNWTAPFEDERTALAEVFAAIKARIEDPDDELKAINIGLMMFTETGGDDNSISGGYVRAAVRPMGEDVPDGISSDPADEIYADLYSKLIAGFHELDDKANAGAAGLAMAEAYYYFAGKTPYAGNNKAKTDYNNNDYENSNGTCCVESLPVWALPENALNSKGGTHYNSPIAPEGGRQRPDTQAIAGGCYCRTGHR